MLLVDSRWNSVSGIGRYSTELTTRLNIPHKLFNSKISPSSPLDVANPSRWRTRISDSIYSPGFNVGICQALQYPTLHDMIHLSPLHRTKAKVSYYDYIVRPVLARSGTVFTVSETSREIIQEWLGDDQIQVVNTGNGCSEVFFSATRQNDLSFTQPYFLYVGNNKPHKNVQIILDTLRTNPNFHVVIVSQDSSMIKKMASDIAVIDQLSFPENVTDLNLAKLYANAIATLLPSSIEGFGLPAVESLATGTPVIYWSGCQSVHEIVGEYGLAIDDVSTADDLISAMRSMLDNPRSQTQVDQLWIDSYKWNSVAAKVNVKLREQLERNQS